LPVQLLIELGLVGVAVAHCPLRMPIKASRLIRAMRITKMPETEVPQTLVYPLDGALVAGGPGRGRLTATAPP
jgi:hypothetical protein